MTRVSAMQGAGGARGREPRRRFHFDHVPGLLYIVVTVFLALGAFNSQNNLLFWSLGLAFGGLLVSGVVSGSALMAIEIRREPVSPTREGEPIRIRYLIANASRLVPAFAMHVEEVDEHARGAPPPSWRDHMDKPAGLALHVGPRERVLVTCDVRTRRRGEVRFSAVRVWTTFPFGITRKSVTFYEEGSAIIRPRQVTLRPSLVDSIRGRLSVGHESTSRPGFGEEFFGLREYAAGDPPRMIAWRPSARLGHLVVRTTTTPSPRKLWVVLRLPGESAGEEMDERAISVGASLVTLGTRLGYGVGLAVPLAGVLVSARAEPRHADRLLNELGRLDLASVRARPHPDRFPAAASQAGGCVVVHAGALDPAWGSRRARHLSVRSMGSLLADEEGEGAAPARRRKVAHAV